MLDENIILYFIDLAKSQNLDKNLSEIYLENHNLTAYQTLIQLSPKIKPI